MLGPMYDFYRYLRAVFMNWLGGFWFMTAIPEIANLFTPDRFAKLVGEADEYISAEHQYAFILGLGVLGLVFASFQAWRAVDREIGLRVRIRNIRCLPSGPATNVYVHLEIFNSGNPSVATDWTLSLGKESVRSSVRQFQSGDIRDFDPQMKPIPQGAGVFGVLTFQTAWPQEVVERSKLRLTFKDVARRKLRAVVEPI
jgi:hypothetical protein